MKCVSLFKKIPWVYFVVQAVAFALSVTFVALMPKAYIYWDIRKVSGYVVALLLSYGYVGYLLADLRGRKTAGIVVETVLFGIFGAALYPAAHLFLAILAKVGFVTSLRIAEILLLAFACVAHILVFFRLQETFPLRKTLFSALAIVLICLSLGITIAIPFGGTFVKRYLRPYSFLTEPSVFLSGDDYAVLFATSAPGSASVTIQKDGVETVYYEERQGVHVYASQLHRIDLPKSVLDGATYYLTSKQTLNSEDHCLRSGKEIRSSSYTFRPYNGNGDVSFLVVSDNQGTPNPTQKAVQNAQKTKQYDFVLMLGDQSEMYNDVETDIVDSYLKITGLASHGEIPVVATLGNHEYRGMLAPDLWDMIPTPSKTGEFYYTFTMGDAFFSVMSYGTDHNDDYEEKYGGLVDFNSYKDKEYEWLQTIAETKPYENYRYNVMLSHIPLIFANNETAYEYVCSECKKKHDYKYKEFCDLAEEMGVDYVVSGHTHVAPATFTSDKYSYMNLQTGSYYANRAHFRNSIVHLKDGNFTFEVYSSEN